MTAPTTAASRIAHIQSRFGQPVGVRTDAARRGSGTQTGGASGAGSSLGSFEQVLSQALTQGIQGIVGGSTGVRGLLNGPGGVGLRGAADVAGFAPSGAGGSGGGDALVQAAMKYQGIPYVWGGNDPNVGLDCSGFVKLVAAELGIELPRVADDQARMGTPVGSLAEARPGDLLAFGTPVTHIGIYMGDGKMIDASRSLNSIVVRDVWETPSAIRRVTPEGSPAAFAAGVRPTGGPVGGGPTPGTPYAELFASAGARHGIDPRLLASVARIESNFDNSVVSSAGAQGLMQFMPSTAAGMGVDPWNPASAVEGAARLLVSHRDKFGSIELALAAYNAGPNAVQRFGGIPPYAETQAYVRKVMQAYQGGRA